MIRYVAARLIQAVPLLAGISLVAFAMLQMTPGGPLSGFFDSSQFGTVTPDEIARMRARYQLDGPPWEQYLRWLAGFVTGDWGESYVSARPVTDVVLERVPTTLLVAGLALLFTLLLSLRSGSSPP